MQVRTNEAAQNPRGGSLPVAGQFGHLEKAGKWDGPAADAVALLREHA